MEDEVVDQYKTIYAHEKPHQVISQLHQFQYP